MPETVRIKLNIDESSGTPPFEYRVDGGAWQDSPVFEVPTIDDAGGYLFEALDAEGCIAQYPMYEEKIALELIGGYVTPQLSVVASYGSNIPVQAQIDWGIGSGYPYDENDFEGTTEWTEEFSTINIIPFPVSFTGSLHFFRARGRSRLGQELQNSIRGIYYVPSELEVASIIESYVEHVNVLSLEEINSTNKDHILVTSTVNQGTTQVSMYSYNEDIIILPVSTINSTVEGLITNTIVNIT